VAVAQLAEEESQMEAMFFNPGDWQSIITRLIAAALIGSAIGMNRDRKPQKLPRNWLPKPKQS